MRIYCQLICFSQMLKEALHAERNDTCCIFESTRRNKEHRKYMMKIYEKEYFFQLFLNWTF